MGRGCWGPFSSPDRRCITATITVYLMTSLFHSLLLALASATHKESARQVKFLKGQNEIVRGKLPKLITVTPKERNRLVRFARASDDRHSGF